MPRKNSPGARVATDEVKEGFIREPQIPLTLEERVALRAAIQSKGFQKALRNLRHLKPSAFTAELNGVQGAVIANNRLHEIRGWEMFETALGAQLLDPRSPAPRAKETYIDESTIKP